MAETFDISLDSLAKPSVAPGHRTNTGTTAVSPSDGGTFFLETFGCQMNDHDSEKVAGVLFSRGYRQVESPDAASLVLYNTCSIREKAAQKVFSRVGELPETAGVAGGDRSREPARDRARYRYR